MLRTRLEAHWQRGLEFKRSNWARLSSVLDSLSPLKVVERGYSITYKDTQVVKSAGQLAAGDKLEIAFAKGRIAARVESILEQP